MQIVELEPFISDTVFVFLQMLLSFGFVIWFGLSQIRATRRSREADKAPSSLAKDGRPRTGR
ncbi:MAG: hypothetical protein ACFBRM_00030 [Pikeienuella sp.]